MKPIREDRCKWYSRMLIGLIAGLMVFLCAATALADESEIDLLQGIWQSVANEGHLIMIEGDSLKTYRDGKYKPKQGGRIEIKNNTLHIRYYTNKPDEASRYWLSGDRLSVEDSFKGGKLDFQRIAPASAKELNEIIKQARSRQ